MRPHIVLFRAYEGNRLALTRKCWQVVYDKDGEPVGFPF